MAEETFMTTLYHGIKEARKGDGTLLDLVCQDRNDQYFHQLYMKGKADLIIFSEKSTSSKGLLFPQHPRAECAWD